MVYGQAFSPARTGRNPQDAFSRLWLARVLTELGNRESAIDACLDALDYPEVRGAALLQLARNYEAQGKHEDAVTALEEASLAGLMDDDGLLTAKGELASLRKEPQVKMLLGQLGNPKNRFRALLKSGEGEPFTAFFHSNSLSVNPDNTESLDLLHEALIEYGKASRRGKADPVQAEHLRVAGKALDATLESGKVSDYVGAWLRWGPDEVEAEAKGWKGLRGLAGLTRSHKFNAVIERADALARGAEERGDLLQLFHARVSASVAHLAILDFPQPRSKVSAATEASEGTRKIREALAIARSLGSVSGMLTGLDYLCSIELHLRAMEDAEYDLLICEAVVLSNRIIPKARELGMWEQLWRNQRSDGGKR